MIIFNNIYLIIKLKGALKTIGVNNGEERKQGEQCKCVFPSAGKTPADTEVKSIILVDHFHSYGCLPYSLSS